MEALTSSCSKVLIDGHGSSSASRVRFSDKVGFCFSLGSQNDEKVGKFRILQMIQNKGISPVHALPSKTQVLIFTINFSSLKFLNDGFCI